MDKLQDTIRDRKITSINKKIPEILLIHSDVINWSNVKTILEDCVLIEYRSKNVVDLCNIVILNYKSINKKKPKDMDSNERSLRTCKSISDELLKIIPYRFIFMGGAMLDVKTIYATTHTEAWNKANNYTVNVRFGNIRCVLCIEVDGNDIGTFHNLNYMFTPKEIGVINAAKADDLLPDWKNYK